MPEADQSQIYEQLKQILLRLDGLPTVFGTRKQVAPTVCWVEERELPLYFPYTLQDFRKMRKDGRLRSYPDISGGKKILYNLYEVSAKIQGAKNAELLNFDPFAVKVKLD